MTEKEFAREQATQAPRAPRGPRTDRGDRGDRPARAPRRDEQAPAEAVAAAEPTVTEA